MMMKLQHGDCLKLMNEIPPGSVDMILCDLPYGATRCRWDTVIPFDQLWRQYKRVIKDNGAIVLFGTEPFATMLRASNLKMYRYDIIWCKNIPTGFLNSNRMPLRKHENICVFYKQLPTYNPQKTTGTPYKKHKNHSNIYGKFKEQPRINDGTRYPTSIVSFPSVNTQSYAERLHPTQKPVALLEYLIKTYTNPGDTVLDNCMGSGSTGVACVNTERGFIGIELDDKYYDIANERISMTMECKFVEMMRERN